jgi:hypothetical protein
MKRCAYVVSLVVLGLMFAPTSYGQAPAPTTSPKTEEGVTVLGAQDKIINDFVYSTVAPTNTLIGQLARWEEAICPVTSGLSPDFDKFVTARVKEVAAQVGAKVQPKSPCRTNLQIIFSPHPQALMDAVRKKAGWLLGSHYKAQEKDLAIRRRRKISRRFATRSKPGTRRRRRTGTARWRSTTSVISAATSVDIPCLPD